MLPDAAMPLPVVPPESLQAALGLQRNGPAELARTVLLALQQQHAPHPAILSALGVLALQAGDLVAAQQYLADSLALQPNQASVHSNRGIALAQLGQPAEAFAAFAAAMQCDPAYADAYYNRGSLYQQQEQFEEALADYDQAIARAPRLSKAWQSKALLLNAKKDWQGELACYDVLVELQPTDANTHYNRGNTLRTRGSREEALAAYQQALSLQPDHAGAHNNLSTLYYALQQYDRSLEHCERALAIQPIFVEATTNRGNALRGLGRYEAALACYEQALAQAPDYVSAAWNKALLLLLWGDYRAGWAAYESRWERPGATIPGTTIPTFVKPETRWVGEPPLEKLAGQTVLIYPEQGLGDLLQFCRYVPVLEAAGAKVILQTRAPVHALLQSLSPTCQFVDQKAPPPRFDWHCALMSLPHACQTTLDTVPQHMPYLHPDPARIAVWATRIGPRRRPRMGLVWAGNPKHTNDHNRSLPLAQLAPLFDLPVEWHCLQKEIAPADLRELKRLGVHHHAANLSDFSETAALCALLDRVVSVDTSVAHLAGALGKPLDVLLPANPDFRWLMDRTDSPWYPSARLYRQRTPGDWADPIRRLCSDLQSESAPVTPDRALPDHPAVLSAAAALAFQQGRIEQGKALLQRSLAQDARQPRAWQQLGACLAQEAAWEAALHAFEQADLLQPDHAQTIYNLGVILKELGRFEAALVQQRRAHALAPEDAEIRWNRALLELQQGEFDAGWALYEARWARANAAPRPGFKQPVWLGQVPIQAKRLLVLAEQGFGDFLQMARYLPLLAQQAKALTVTVPTPLLPLMQSQPWPIRWVDRYEAVTPFDLQCPVMSLPLACQTSLETIPSGVPYLQADPARVTFWQAHLGPRTRARIGFVWSGNPLYRHDQRRSLTLQALEKWFDLPVSWHCLQKEIAPADQVWLAAKGVHIHADSLRDFADTAALCQQMDLVISVDTAVAHLAGALARPLWVLLPAVPDYRWLLGRTDSPWYPTAQLYRQAKPGDWSGVVAQVAEHLQAAYVDPAAAFQRYLALHRAGDFEQAVAGYRRLLPRSPKDAMLLSLLGAALFPLGQVNEAETLLRQALEVAPGQADAWNNLSLVLNAQGRYDDALDSVEHALGVKADFADAHSNRGLILLALKRYPEALAATEEALRLNPQHVDAWFNQGNVYQAQKNPAAALESFEQAARIQPGDARFWHNRGNALNALGQFEAALESYAQAVRLDPGHVKARYNRGVILEEQGRFDDADMAYLDALSVDANHLKSRWNRVLLQLLRGHYLAGWPGYELRWSLPEAPQKPAFSQPEWQGEQLSPGDRLLLIPEQGLGDFIQASRYALELAAQGVQVVLQTPTPLMPVMRTLSAAVTLVEQGQPLPAFDRYCPIMSLPKACRSTLENLPGGHRYLAAEATTLAEWKNRLGTATLPRIGLVWSGNPSHQNDHRRSLTLAQLSPLWDLPVEWHCLQKVVRPEERAEVAALGIRLHADQLTDFGQTAALCTLMDVVISVDTSVAHLAGAMGKPLWLMLPFVPDFRWLLARDDSPWYPSARLFRQASPGDWAGVVQSIARALRDRQLVDVPS